MGCQKTVFDREMGATPQIDTRFRIEIDRTALPRDPKSPASDRGHFKSIGTPKTIAFEVDLHREMRRMSR